MERTVGADLGADRGVLPLECARPHQRDLDVQFDEVTHTYIVTRGGEQERVPVSVTAFAKAYFKHFDARAVVQKHYAKWKASPDSKYYALIQEVLQPGGSDADAQSAIELSWAASGSAASREGTRMHSDAERLCNGLPPATESKEMGLLRAWLDSFQPHMNWKPARTEWRLWWDEPALQGRVLVAGTLDLLLQSESTDEYALVDFKRTNPAPKRACGPANLLGPHEDARYHHPGYAASPLGDVENSDFGKYGMQLNVLAKMLRERYDVDVADNMFLLQLHPDLESAHCVRVPSHRAATDSLFRIEAERQALAKLGV